MTPLARIVILTGVILATSGTLLWITTGNAKWFAGGGAIFIFTILAGIILSIEVKNGHRNHQHHSPTQTYQEPNPNTQTYNDPFSS